MASTAVEWLLFVLLLSLALVLRSYRLTSPLGDWHSFRQADTASVTNEYVKHGIDLLRPQYQDLSNIQSGQDNLAGWRMVEFPLVNGIIAAVLRWQSGWSLVVVSRLFSIGASLVTLLVLFWLTRQLYGRAVAWVAALVFALMPYSIYFSRTILPEPFAVMSSMLAAGAAYQWSQKRADRWLLAAGAFFSLALLLKPMAIFYAPFILGAGWRHLHWHPKTILKGVVVAVLAILPLWWWRQWIQQFPSGIPASSWLLNGNNIRLRPAWWRWLFADRLGRLMFGYWGAPFLGLGWVAGCSSRWTRPTSLTKLVRQLDDYLRQEGALMLGALGMLAYLVVFATGNVQHDYYQIFLVPILALMWARGAAWLISLGRGWQRLSLVTIVGAAGVFSLVFAWYDIKGNFDTRNPAIVPAGRAVQRLTPLDARVIAPGFGDTTLLFQTNRRGWPIGFEIEDKITKGAQFYITTSQDDEANELMRRYAVLEKTPDYILIDLGQQRVI